MDRTSYLERWTWLGLALLVFVLLSPSAVLVGLVLWLWLHWKPRGWWCWVFAVLLLLGSWAGLVLVWGLLAGQFVVLREALTSQAGAGTILTRALPVWGEGTLLGPTIAGLVQWFRPQPLVRPAPCSNQPSLRCQRNRQHLRSSPMWRSGSRCPALRPGRTRLRMRRRRSLPKHLLTLRASAGSSIQHAATRWEARRGWAQKALGRG